MRSLWKGSISFGLVNIPVRLYTATENRDIRFNSLHRECGSQIRYLKFCPHCEKEVSQDEIVRGYPVSKGQFITVEDEELEALPVETARQVDIVDFVSLSEIDPIYFEKSYYLEPHEGSEKPYALLRDAMEKTGRVAIAKVAIRQKESLACVRVYQNALVMETMHYPDEIRSVQRLAGIENEPKLSEKEMDMAERLIENLTEEFAPEKYRDEYREALEGLIASKITGEEVAHAPPPAAGKVVDLMSALEASLKATAPEKNEPSVRRSIRTKRSEAKDAASRRKASS